MKIRQAALIGMGAIGTVYGKLLYGRYGADFGIIASGERGEKLRRSGTVLDGERFYPRVPDAGETDFRPGLILVCVKNYQLEAAVNDMRPFVRPGTVILPLLNGITAREELSGYFPDCRVLYGLTVRIDAVRTAAGVSHTDDGHVQFGDAANDPPAPDVLEVKAFLDASSVETEIAPDMIRAVWKKWMLNVGVNQVSAVTGSVYGRIMPVGANRELFHEAMEEVVALAQKCRINLSEKDVQEFETLMETFSPEGKTSMLQDVEAGRRTEVENFGGTVVRLGKKYGVPTPVNHVLYRVIQSIEAQRGLCPLPSPAVRRGGRH